MEKNILQENNFYILRQYIYLDILSQKDNYICSTLHCALLDTLEGMARSVGQLLGLWACMAFAFG